MSERGRAHTVPTLNTVAFTVGLAWWAMHGGRVAHVLDQVFAWDATRTRRLIGIPMLSALMRLPVGVLTDRYGGRLVSALLMLASAASSGLRADAGGPVWQSR